MSTRIVTVDSWEQMSLFDTFVSVVLPQAISLFDGSTYEAFDPEPWMTHLVAKARKAITIGRHPMVLTPTTLKPEEIPEGHTFYHFLMDNIVYSGMFVGSASNSIFDEDVSGDE